ncbi:Pentatricopeptide repeat-containing protein, partial [Cucurbita argyrosperma subsp. sororia]
MCKTRGFVAMELVGIFLVQEALKFFEVMIISGVKPKEVLIVGNVELSHNIQDYILELDPEDSGVLVLLPNISATNERWSNVSRLRRLMKRRGVKKADGSSVIEVDGKAHEFMVGDISHLQTVINLINSVYHDRTKYQLNQVRLSMTYQKATSSSVDQVRSCSKVSD